jgi:hypothetical protein
MDPIRLVKAAIPENLSMKVTEIIPQLKDGGAFVKFQHDADIDSDKIESGFISLNRSHRTRVTNAAKALWLRILRRIR